ncbi:MAG TPA: hypothetical protein VGG25_13910 [Streptosporangiaceae bacterium]
MHKPEPGIAEFESSVRFASMVLAASVMTGTLICQSAGGQAAGRQSEPTLAVISGWLPAASREQALATPLDQHKEDQMNRPRTIALVKKLVAVAAVVAIGFLCGRSAPASPAAS